jgi:hypothetical protein
MLDHTPNMGGWKSEVFFGTDLEIVEKIPTETNFRKIFDPHRDVMIYELYDNGEKKSRIDLVKRIKK